MLQSTRQSIMGDRSNPPECDADPLVGRSDMWKASDSLSRNARATHDEADKVLTSYAGVRALSDVETSTSECSPPLWTNGYAGPLRPGISGVWPSSAPRSFAEGSAIARDDRAKKRFLVTHTRSRMYRVGSPLSHSDQVAP